MTQLKIDSYEEFGEAFPYLRSCLACYVSDFPVTAIQAIDNINAREPKTYLPHLIAEIDNVISSRCVSFNVLKDASMRHFNDDINCAYHFLVEMQQRAKQIVGGEIR